ncbi:MAG TPA: preprotein translocase subunit SecG [Clostridia bacterium]|nr:MAG: preprotein translocase subunit SecG [Clostridiales bacterium]HKL10991.1 preprotein translocase subunit SecG [Clostridia bacterium]
MSTVFMVIQIITSIILIASILLQPGKSAGLSGAIGGGAEQIWGKQKGRGIEEIMAKITKIGAIVFIISSLAMVYLQ